MAKYVVGPGDTLGTIAAEFLGAAKWYTKIAAANKIDNPNQIRVGQELVIPEAGSPEGGPGAKAAMGEPLFTAGQLESIMHRVKDDDLHFYIDALNVVLPSYGITTELRKAHFIAQIAHESGELKYRSENLNYGAEALRRVFGKYFPDEVIAEAYARKPEAIANKVYANRMGNGDEAGGDGWRYRGRGLIQLTGKDNYRHCGAAVNKDLVKEPDLLTTSADMSVTAACWYWDTHDLNKLADQDDIKAITKKINGGYNGLEDRQKYLDNAKKVLGIA